MVDGSVGGAAARGRAGTVRSLTRSIDFAVDSQPSVDEIYWAFTAKWITQNS